MREPENCKIDYCGYTSPMTKEEVDFEVLGLMHLIKTAEQRVSFLRQTQYLAELMGDGELTFEEASKDEDH